MQCHEGKIGLSLDGVNQVLGGPGTHLVVGQGNGGEARVQVGGNQFLVIKAHHGEVARDTESQLRSGTVRSHGHPVVVAEQCRGHVGTVLG